MISSQLAKAAAIAALMSWPLQTQALELVGGPAPGAHINDGAVQTVQYRHPVAHGHPGYRPGVHPGYRPGVHPGYGPGVHPGYGYHGGGYRAGGVVVGPRVGWVGRPGWYRWAPGGAIAAGAAIGFVTAAVAASWAPPPPQPDLCWYYTDPSRTQGFWDACP
jgi:hypothetical protein